MSLTTLGALATRLTGWSRAIASRKAARQPARSPRGRPTTPDSGLPLTMVGAGSRGRLAAITASRALAHRLADLGLTPGVPLEVVRDDGGPVLLAVRETRLALGRGMAQQILIRLDTRER